ncbi:uncharacterized protein PRCAT00001774001 [Priceomyces carsonii]|uniref:uncharacterized protein n=1 Tax=Priceomyces carsonii TaxID=28549 RepID=UPI002ED97177|nr:unnamed protein product [Priceomyces carsonii]
MYVQTPKRPMLPSTPTNYGKTVLPPLSSILSLNKPESPPENPILAADILDKTPRVQTDANVAIRYQPHIRQSESHAGFSRPRVGEVECKQSEEIQVCKIKREDSRSNSIKKQLRRSSVESKAFAFISHSPATFPSQEPSIDNIPLARRKRRRTSPNELSILNTEFDLGSTPNKSRRIEIASRLSMSEKAVQIWFQNKRQSLRKQSNCEREVTVLPPTPPVSATLVSSTPVKPVLGKSQSFINSPTVIDNQSPVTYRSNSIPVFLNPHSSTVTPLANKTVKQLITPNSSFINEESSTSVDSINTLVLNETRKKQPEFLNSTSSSTMTFKLTPATRSPSTAKNQKLNGFSEKESLSSKTSINSILNNFPSTRQPLGEININISKTNKKVKDSECVENLLSLRTGNWK